ncbi:LPS export ABC transporter periplasmic protein LptC [Herbaspirillum sp. ST 5-3]|uniref:LPS export ABC transporter periplasmic protein LptC n=1 Tax=Oxalobacteraceae TaxID=75682 RepID=UPI001FFEF802|nr:LPS export ABC transporter periplasmic protein LptC [Herbaspirillum sp. ST 5-3]
MPAIALALGSFWLLEVMRRSASDFIPNQERSEPDFYVEKFSYVKLGKTGKVQYHFSGAKLTHNPKDDSYDITLPVINNLGEATMPMTMRSERAHVNSDNSRIQLFNNVQVDRPASATSQHLHATSEYLLVLPDDEVMKTDEPVEITVGASTLSGVGMFADNATREFRLTSNVHGTYQVPQR